MGFALVLGAGCAGEESTSGEDRYPSEDMSEAVPYDTETITTADVVNCLVSSGQAGYIASVTQFGNPIQTAVSSAAAAGYSSCYAVVSSGNAASWNTASSVVAGGACSADPAFGTLCDRGGFDLGLNIPNFTSRIVITYKFYEWDYVPYEDPFDMTLYVNGNPAASTGSKNSCEFSNKSGTALAIGNVRKVIFNIDPSYWNQNVTLRFQSADRYDQILDSGALIDSIEFNASPYACSQAVCGGCADVASCASINADGDAYNSCTDCNDNNPNAYPGAAEVCNGLDDNCSGQADEGGVCCVDNDSDGYTGCNGDCNDGNAAVKPGATEICDGIDNDCNGEIDYISNVPVCAPPDDDDDGVNQNDDCNDNDATVYPGAAEICDEKDNDCDGAVDEGTCVPNCVSITDGVNGGSAQDALLPGDLPNSPQGPYFGGWTGLSSGGNLNYTVMKWSLAGLPQGPNVNVTQANIDVVTSWNDFFNLVTVHRANAAWSEATVTYNNYFGNWDANALASFNGGGPGHHAATITTLVEQWMRGEVANNGIVLAEAPINSHYFWTRETSQAALRPTLNICYYVTVGN